MMFFIKIEKSKEQKSKYTRFCFKKGYSTENVKLLTYPGYVTNSMILLLLKPDRVAVTSQGCCIPAQWMEFLFFLFSFHKNFYWHVGGHVIRETGRARGAQTAWLQHSFLVIKHGRKHAQMPRNHAQMPRKQARMPHMWILHTCARPQVTTSLAAKDWSRVFRQSVKSSRGFSAQWPDRCEIGVGSEFFARGNFSYEKKNWVLISCTALQLYSMVMTFYEC